MKKYFILFGLINFLFISSQAFSSLPSYTLSANQSKQNTDDQSVELEGQVLVTFNGNTLSADYAKIQFGTHSIYAKGHVKIVSTEATLIGSEALFDLENSSGLIHHSQLISGNVYFEGQTIYKTPEGEYVTVNGKYTTCQNCPETWSFVTSKIRAHLGGYAYMKNLFIRFGGVPVFWMPYLVVPLKSERQTGLLTPEFEFSSLGGLTVSQSLFWAINPSHDITLSLKNYELRGLKGLFNYRYFLDKKSYGELDLGSLNDRVVTQSERFSEFSKNTTPNASSRWFLKYKHFFELPDNTIYRVNINNSSDLQYAKDFPLETLNHGDPAMENRTSLTKNFNSTHTSIELSYPINLLESDPLSNNQYSVHRMPEININKTAQPMGSSLWYYQWNLNSVQFARNYMSYDDLENTTDSNGNTVKKVTTLASTSSPLCQTDPKWYLNSDCVPTTDGIYDPALDLIRTGHRLTLDSMLFRTYEWNQFYLTPSFLIKDQTYRFDIADLGGAHRTFARLNLAAFTPFYRLYNNGNLKHEIQPEMTFTTIPWLIESTHPFFGNSAATPYTQSINISDQDLNSPWGLQFDYHDRVFDRKVVTTSILNKWTRKSFLNQNENSNSYQTLATWRLSQSYDLYQEELSLTTKEPLSDLSSELSLYLNQFRIYQKASYYPYQNISNHSTRARYILPSQDFIEISHLLSYNITPGKETDPKLRTEDTTLYFKHQFYHSTLLARGTWDGNYSNQTGGRLKSAGISAQLSLPGDCWYLTLAHYQITGGDSVTRINFDFIWDPKKRPTVPEDFFTQIGF